ncbi:MULTISPECIES: NAD(P)-dependent oxidoreductase [Pseudomonas]|jgi:nucleoside-diphosphate-sugar epimerase|uniref:NAD-dependent epimerase/dehydratase family protein n=1 Tax=Pseudomonas TaxID=286 RepID=UPI0009E26871|nr:NAD-dependent epimerase/dehydratase family protein [Pseudomonas sp. PI1]
MKLAITGANGFVGKHLVELLGPRYEVFALSRTVPDERLSGVTYIATDYSVASLLRHLAGMDGLVHLAATRPKGAIDSDVLGNVSLDYRVLLCAEQCALQRVVLASTRGVYGRLPVPWSEVQAPAPESPYALAKRHSELTADYFMQRGLNVVTLRLAQVFGLGEYASSAIATFIRKAYRDEPVTLTVTGILREYLYIRDIATAIEATLLRSGNGVFNLGSGECSSLEQIARTIFRAFGREHRISEAQSMKSVPEHSLMDSSCFRREFDWAPAWTLRAAAEDIAMTLHDKREAAKYGLSGD